MKWQQITPFLLHLQAVSIRTKIWGMVLGLVFILGAGITIQVRQAIRWTLEQQLGEQSVSIAHDVSARAADLILVNDLYALHQLLTETKNNNPDVRYAFVVSPHQQILAHTFGDGFPASLLSANTVSATAHHHTLHLETDEGQIWDTAVPILNNQVGTVRIGLSETRLQNTQETLTGQILLTTIMVSAVGIAAATWLTWVITQPILELKTAVQTIGRGQAVTPLHPWAEDEIGELTHAFNGMSHQLTLAAQERTEKEQLRTQLLEKVITAQEEERRRISRELHDETGQALTSLMVQLQNMCQSCAAVGIQPQMVTARHLLTHTLDNIHNLARELRPSVLDDLGLEAALQRYVQDYQQRQKVNVDLVILGLQQRLPPAVEIALYRIVQECLTNIARHAQAATASIFIERRPQNVRLIIEDDGVGFDVAAAFQRDRLGLYGMKERAQLLNGSLQIESSPGQGSAVMVEVPL